MPDFAYENQAKAAGHILVAGVDEAGRGPLAGPVYAAAVIFTGKTFPKGLDDSKKLTPKRRQLLETELRASPDVIFSVASSSPAEIDQLNILRATHLAMRRAVEGLQKTPDFCLIDGLPMKGFPFQSDGIVKGDALSLSIAAASVLAKEARDRDLERLDERFPEYGFARHKGYPTKAHLAALRKFGPCSEHRNSFRPVAECGDLFGE